MTSSKVKKQKSNFPAPETNQSKSHVIMLLSKLNENQNLNQCTTPTTATNLIVKCYHYICNQQQQRHHHYSSSRHHHHRIIRSKQMMPSKMKPKSSLAIDSSIGVPPQPTQPPPPTQQQLSHLLPTMIAASQKIIQNPTSHNVLTSSVLTFRSIRATFMPIVMIIFFLTVLSCQIDSTTGANFSDSSENSSKQFVNNFVDRMMMLNDDLSAKNYYSASLVKRTPIFQNEFAVYIPSGQEEANRVAAKYGFTNLGQVSDLF